MSKSITFKQWQAFAARVNSAAKRIQDARHEEGWKLAASVGIDRNACCVHNASIDDDLKGWCFQNPERLKVAKRANNILNDWTPSQKARRIIARAWDRVER